eukprot:9483870-Pyramimonas_sp.AAC.2
MAMALTLSSRGRLSDDVGERVGIVSFERLSLVIVSRRQALDQILGGIDYLRDLEAIRTCPLLVNLEVYTPSPRLIGPRCHYPSCHYPREYELARLTKKAQFLCMPKGEAIFNLGDEGSAFYIVLSGSVELIHPPGSQVTPPPAPPLSPRTRACAPSVNFASPRCEAPLEDVSSSLVVGDGGGQ